MQRNYAMQGCVLSVTHIIRKILLLWMRVMSWDSLLLSILRDGNSGMMNLFLPKEYIVISVIWFAVTAIILVDVGADFK